MRFDGKRALVTGAGKGIGRATVLDLARRGATVVALSRSADDLAGLAEEVGCETLQVDLADVAATRAAVRRTLPIDLLVNCAGITDLAPAVEASIESFDAVMAVNGRAPLVVAQEVAADLFRRGAPGAIVNVSSVASFQGLPDHVAYCASKGALDAITRVLANEWGRRGIRVNGVHPVVTLTPMAVKAWSDPAKAGPMQARIPLGRFVEPHEVAAAIAYLLSDDAAMVNGIDLPVDGGFLIN